MAENIEKSEIERKEGFLKEFEELRKKWGVDFAIDLRLSPEIINFPK